MTLVKDVQKIQSEMKSMFFERTDAIEAIILAVLSKNHIFIVGPPGTSKSLMIRDLTSRLTGASHFEALLTRTSPAENILGPLDMPQFRDKGSYVRRTKGFLPEADFAFLDELGNMGPTLGHHLLSILNERLLHEVDDATGRSSRTVPLHTAFAAGNQTPVSESEEADALWDRILLRVKVDYIRSEKNFKALFNRGEPNTRTTVAWADLKNAIDEEISQVTLPDNILELIGQLKMKMQKATPNPFILSDRRWQGAERLLKAAAWLRGSDTVSAIDIKVMKYMVWTEEDQITQTERFVLSVSDKTTEATKDIADQLREIQKGVDERKDKKSDDRASHAVSCNKKMKSIETDIRKLNADNPNHAEVKKVWDMWMGVNTDIYVKMMDMAAAPKREL